MGEQSIVPQTIEQCREKRRRHHYTPTYLGRNLAQAEWLQIFLILGSVLRMLEQNAT